MKGRLIAAALVLVIVGGVGHAAGKAPAKEGPGVTTLEPSTGDGWRTSDDPADPFTPVGVIGGHGADANLDNPVTLPPDAAVPIPGGAPAKDPPSARFPWLSWPVTWGMLLLGVAMIGFALRGLVAARRRLARLETPEH